MDQSTVGPPEPDEADTDERGVGGAAPDAPSHPISEDQFDPIRRLKELQERLGFGDLTPAAADTDEVPATPTLEPDEQPQVVDVPAPPEPAPAWSDTVGGDHPAVEPDPGPTDEGTPAVEPVVPTTPEVTTTWAAAAPAVPGVTFSDPSPTPTGRDWTPDPFEPTPRDLLPPPSDDPRSVPPSAPPAGDELPLPPSITPAGPSPTEPPPPTPSPATAAVVPPPTAPPHAGQPVPPRRSYAFPTVEEPVPPAPAPIAPVAPPSRAHLHRRWTVAVLAFISGLLGTLLAVGALVVFGVLEPSAGEETASTTLATAPPVTIIERITTELVPSDSGTAAIATAVGQKVIPSIVTVQTNAGSGSGVVISADGYIVSNDHVVAGASDYFVAFNDGRTYEASLIGSDPLTDLAVLRVESTELVPIEIGMTGELTIGDTAIAVGSPLGLEGGPSLTLGVLSAFNRSVNVGPDPSDVLFGMLQTDAPITLGSSGGALVNQAGQLIGITTAIGVSSAGAEGIGFATPAEIVMRVVDEIIEFGFVRHAFLGVSLGDHVVEEPDGSTTPGGSLVSELVGDSAAGDAGIQPGDVIVRFDDNSVRNRQDLIVGLRRYRVGDVVEFEVLRGDETLTFSVELRQRPEEL